MRATLMAEPEDDPESEPVVEFASPDELHAVATAAARTTAAANAVPRRRVDERFTHFLQGARVVRGLIVGATPCPGGPAVVLRIQFDRPSNEQVVGIHVSWPDSHCTATYPVIEMAPSGQFATAD